MTIIFFLIAASTIVAVIFLAAFVWAMRTGQYDDDRSPAVRILEPEKRVAGKKVIGEWSAVNGGHGVHQSLTTIHHSPASSGEAMRPTPMDHPKQVTTA